MEENENGDFYPELKLNLENENDYDIKVEVQPNNEYLNNKLIENNGTITVSNLMTTPNTKDGISKNSTLEVSVNPYLPNNYQQTLNYVGYWKWDSTNQTFIQVLNDQDIIEEKYNLKIQPLFYDADTGLPQKVTVNSGNTKRLKMVNDNNDGSMEIADYVENRAMVKFDSKTKSVTEYPYFEVEALPPTISSPITSNGYYKFDGNTLISGTSSDYNLNVSVTPIISIDKIVLGDNGTVIASNDINSNWTFYGDVTSDRHSISVTTNNEILIIGKVYTDYRWRYMIKFYWDITSGTLSIPDNCWVYNYNKAGSISAHFYFYSMNSEYFGIEDSSKGDKNCSIIVLKTNKFNFNGINWMTFD